MSRCETFFVIGDGLDKNEIMIPRVKVIQNSLMHSELHAWFNFRLYMYNEHHLTSPVGHQVLETQVSHHYNIVGGISTEPHTVVVAVHCCLVGNYNCADFTLK